MHKHSLGFVTHSLIWGGRGGVWGGARDKSLKTSTWTVNVKSGSKRLKLARTKAGSGETRLYSYYDFSGLLSTLPLAQDHA